MEETLTTLRLLRPVPGRPDALVPVSPDAAAADLVGPAETARGHLRTGGRVGPAVIQSWRGSYASGMMIIS
ncbi:hypothetical protein Slala05_72670 [Streptomyces lavendulae subsp. lavendulae]|nr:hypothetical protein Slala05_72670 [Streptomyces lavendulae subsp. lavendulae]